MSNFSSHCLRPLAVLGLLLATAGGLLRPLGAAAQTYPVSTLAGTGTAGAADGPAASATFNYCRGVAVDASGTVYVADQGNNKIRKITATGSVTTFAGSGTYGAADATGTSATLGGPTGVTIDASGTFYIADAGNNKIRKITSAGVVTTFAGSGTAGFFDATGTSAQFNYPTGVAVDASGTVYVAESGGNRIRKITPGGVVTTLAGSSSGTAGAADGTGTSATFSNPAGVAVDASGTVYVIEYANSKLRKITQAGVVTTFAGSGSGYGSVDGQGTSAQFYYPFGLVLDASGTIYVADQGGAKIRKVTPSGAVTTLAGTGFTGAADGPGSSASFNTPAGVAVDSNGKLYIADAANNKIRLLSPLPAPILTSLSPTNGPVGTSVTLTGTNLTGATNVRFNGTVAVTFAVVNATTVTATVPPGATTGNVTVTTSGGTSNGIGFAVVTDLTVATTQAVAGGTYASITVTGTGVATLAGPVAVSGALTVQAGGVLHTNCQPLTGAGTFTLDAGGTLGLCDPAGLSASGATGTVQLSGTRSFSTDASYIYNGTAAQNTGAGLPAMVRNLTTTNANDVTLAAPTSVTRILTIGAAGNLVLNNQALTLLATPTTAALVVNSSTGYVSGTTATVQTYLDPSLNAGLGYRHLSPPVAGATVAGLATASFTPEVSQGNAFNASATPATVTPFPTVFGYDQGRLAAVTNNLAAFDKGFSALTSTSTGLNPGFGYVVNLAGGQVVGFPGQPITGVRSFPLTRAAASSANATDAGWQLMGNPYPAPYDYSLVLAADRTGLDASMYVFASSGPYTGSYRAYVNGVGGNPVLALGQAFWIRVSSGQTSGSYTFRNSQRLTAPTATTLQRGTTDARPLVQLELRGATGPADVFYAYAEAGATADFDAQLDAVKRTNTTGLNLASLANGAPEGLAIDARPAFTAATVLPLSVGVPAAGTYTLSAAALTNLPTGLSAYLRDAATGQTRNLSQQPVYTLAVSAAQAAAGLSTRFSLSFSPQAALATNAALSASEVTLFPNPAHASFTVLVPAVAGTAQLRAELLNTLGQVVRRLSAALPADGARLTVDTAGLAVGVYTLRLHTGPTTLTKRVVLQ